MKKGYPSDQAIGNQKYGTLQPIGTGRHASDSLIKAVSPLQVADFVPEAGSTISSIKLTGHGFKVGDIVRFTAGPNVGAEASVTRVSVDDIFFGYKFPIAIVATDTFQASRPVSLSSDASGNLVTTAGPLLFIKDAANQEVIKDTVTPANTVGLPVEIVSETQTKEVHESVFVVSQALTTAGYVAIGAAIPIGVTIKEIEVLYKDGSTVELFDASAGNSLGMVTQAGGKVPVSIVGDNALQLHLQVKGADVAVADLTVNLIK